MAYSQNLLNHDDLFRDGATRTHLNSDVIKLIRRHLIELVTIRGRTSFSKHATTLAINTNIAIATATAIVVPTIDLIRKYTFIIASASADIAVAATNDCLKSPSRPSAIYASSYMIAIE